MDYFHDPPFLFYFEKKIFRVHNTYQIIYIYERRKTIADICVSLVDCVWRCVTVARPDILYIYVYNSFFDFPCWHLRASTGRQGPVARVCLLYTYISLIVADDEKKHWTNKLKKKKKSNLSFFGVAKIDKNRMKWKYTADIK